MSTLQELDLSRNKIKKFPTDIGKLFSLQVLNISGNRIQRLPKYLYTMTALEVLKLNQNPITWPPADILNLGGGGNQIAGLHNLRDYISKNGNCSNSC